MSGRDDEYDSGSRQSGRLTDYVRKAISAGIGAVFLTEESVRSYVADAKLPRDVAKSLMQMSATAKDQFFEYLTKEASQLIRKSDLPKVVTEFLRSHEFEVQAKIRFHPVGTRAALQDAEEAESVDEDDLQADASEVDEGALVPAPIASEEPDDVSSDEDE
ncbi:MAG: hypothetical protein ACYTFT_03335 [Planctomycetota bacterium]|jgi:hypothetical protein